MQTDYMLDLSWFVADSGVPGRPQKLDSAGQPSSFGNVATASKWNPGKQLRLRADSASAQAEPDAFRAMGIACASGAALTWVEIMKG